MTRCDTLHRLVGAAGDGDERAWQQLVEAFTPLLSRVARSHRLGDADVDDVVQLTWLQLLRHIRGLDDPGAVRAWLVTTARREALRRLQHGRREYPISDITTAVERPDDASPEDQLLRLERRDAVRVAMRKLSSRQQAVLNALLAEPAPPYDAVAERLGLPVGSIGPTRARSLDRLRRDPRLVLAAG